MTSRNYVLTIWDDVFSEATVDLSKIRYLVFQREKCPSTGKLHYQGYVELFKPARHAGLKKALGCSSVWAKPKAKDSTREQARDYCMKEESRVEGPWEIGAWITGPGARTDLENVVDMIKAGRPTKEIFSEYPETYLRFHGGIDKALAFQQKPRLREELEVKVWWGVPGAGKTHRAREWLGEDIYEWPAKCEEPRGYAGQSCVLIDEFTGWLPASLFKTVTDKWPCVVKVPYGQVAWNPVKIAITSNYDPVTWYNNKVDTQAVVRRMKEIIPCVTRYEVDG